MKPICFLIVCVGLLTGCLGDKSYQSVLFVIDNSCSMTDEAEALGRDFAPFVEKLSAEGRAFYQLAITTTSMTGSAPGTAGGLVGGEEDILNVNEDATTHFNENLFCNTTCWNPADNAIVSDPEYECGSEDSSVPEPMSFQYLDCVCGLSVWESGDACGSGDEEGMEAAFLAMCRAVENPPEDCFHEIYSPLTEADIGSNTGLIREEDELTIVIVSDEGDSSRRLENQDSDPAPYLDLLDQFGVKYRLAVIGPPYSCETNADGEEECVLTCNSGGATTWGTGRYQAAAEASGGFFNPIAEEGSDGDCQLSDFEAHLDDLADLLLNSPAGTE